MFWYFIIKKYSLVSIVLKHQITAMYIDGHLKGGFQTVEAYAGFCGYFKNWLDTKSIKLSVPRQGEMVAEDYRACLEYVNSEVSWHYNSIPQI